MKGRVCLVTGATSGIGRETALGLAAMGATVVVHGRDRRRAEAAVEEMRQRTGNGSVELLVADLSSLHGVRSAAAEFLSRHDELHVLINNAGVILRQRALSADGIEMQLAINHLAPFLLTGLLLAALRVSAPSRIVNVASQVESDGAFDFGDLNYDRGGYEQYKSYTRSKLGNVLFTYELARRLEGSGVTANCLHPGVIATNLLNDFMRRPRILGFLTAKSHAGPAQGARTSIMLASAPELEGVSGKYFKEGVEAQSSRQSYDRALARQLWEKSEELVLAK